MQLSSRSLIVWISATILSILLYLFAFNFFSQTFPLIHLDITMDLQQALQEATHLAKVNNFGPTEYHQAAMFHTDTLSKTFIELEAGGKDALVNMMEKKLYMPYTWRVRHFREYEKNETTLFFTPDGQPYGFIETISENTPGKQLLENDARHIAETNATLNWNIDFHDYILIESSQKTELSGRIDHTFVYQQAHYHIGEGSYRLKIIISGDKMTELTHFIKIPEAFNRRYAEMRSANTIISWAASIFMLLFYILGGCCLGLYWIIKKRWYIIKQPLFLGVILAFAAILVSVNQLPFLWMHYDTAHSSNGFLLQLLLSFFINLIAQTIFITIVIMTAESLTRRAFGKHLQLWSLGKNEIVTSYALLGRVFGGYLFVGFNCAFVIAFYLFSTHCCNWWAPSEMLFDPNVLATYLPWFSPIAQSLNAGIIEECLFRAIPLAGAALLGTYFGKRSWWIASALILQAIVFGAAHANYPMQPSYARLIELFIPSLLWGITYLRFGLIPTIIAHCVYDIIWFSLPIFVSHASHALMYKIIIILITLLPIIILLYARIKKGNWTSLPQSVLNDAWQPFSPVIEQKEETIIIAPISCTFPKSLQKWVCILGIFGLIVWILVTPFTHDGVTITRNRNESVQSAYQFLQQNNILLNESWQILPLFFAHYKLDCHSNLQHKFIWQEGGKELYHSLLGTYLHPAHWTIRYAQFTTDIIQRTEEYRITLYNDVVWRYHHLLPESAVGAELTQHQAREIAHHGIKKQYNIDQIELTEISAQQTQLPHRSDWIFIFSHSAVYPLDKGQARICVTISGDQITDTVRIIHIPEEWKRNEQHEQSILAIIIIIFFLIFLFFLLYGIIILYRKSPEFSFSKQLFFTLLGIASVLLFIESINSWQAIIGMFNTSLPLKNQLFQSLTSLILLTGFKAIMYAFCVTYVISYTKLYQLPKNGRTVGIGICTGLFFAGIIAIVEKILNSTMPLWPHYMPLNYSLPLIANLFITIANYVQITLIFSLLYIMFDGITQQWRQRQWLVAVILVLCGIALSALSSLAMIPVWIFVGTLVGLLLLVTYMYIIRYDYSLIPLATGSFIVLQIIQQGIFNAYPGAMFEAGINACTIVVISAVWYWYSDKTE
ncbi:MAG TPA: CPBP family intramembrane glutamic endopeptidase [Candidatus Babeliales bacterium]|nr:CPBP family intramembrane glutamic endopeptidase [Candidatus Babeliales bacterium]